MFSLPRGTGVSVDVPLASAAWETPQAVERLTYRDGASLFVGAIPAFENWQRLGELYGQGGAALAKIATSDAPPADRARQVDFLEGLWRSALLADCVPLGLDDDRHFVTIAGSRSGKGTSAIIPNLCVYSGSVICLDPKGENASRTAAQRGTGGDGCEGLGQEVFVLDPFGVASVPDGLRAGLNPLALLDPASPSVVDDAAMLAEGLIVSANTHDPHWDESARNFVKGLILHLVTTVERPSLFTLRRFLTQGDKAGWETACEAFKRDAGVVNGGEEGKNARAVSDEFFKHNPSAFAYLLNAMRDNPNPAFSWVIAGAAETLLSCGENERGSILSTARRNTAFLDTINQGFISTLEGTGRTFSPDVFKSAKSGASLFLCLPAERMGTHDRWLRIMIGLLLNWMYRDLSPPACGAPVLFLLEEFYSLGNMSVIEKAAGYAAGFGVKLWAILQDIQQLKAMYPNSWQTFLANAGAMQVFGVSDHDTLAYISKSLGEVEVRKNVTNYSTNQQSGQSTPSPQQKASGMFGGSRRTFLPRVFVTALPDAAESDSITASAATSEQIQIVPLLRPDEIAVQFSRESCAALLLIKGRKPVWCLRVDYYASPWFWGRYAPTAQERKNPRATRTLWERTPNALKAIAVQFTKVVASVQR